MNVTYPVIDSEIAEFCLDKDAVLIVEEGQPEYLEQAINTLSAPEPGASPSPTGSPSPKPQFTPAC